MNEDATIIKTDTKSVDGQNKCPKCGATDISLNALSGMLRCNFCRHEFQPEKPQVLETDVSSLEGTVIASGAQNIVADTSDVVTFKCSSCGAEVVLNTLESTQARCHWCRNILSQNTQIPNGSIPDVVLPFHITKTDAENEIRNFVSKRQFFANPTFKKEFTTNNIMGVYFPYLLVNINGHAHFAGEGEHLVRKYTRGSGSNATTYYDADCYSIEREFDIGLTGLSIESNKDRLNQVSLEKTNNIINAIMPFDTENCVSYNANFLKGYTSERRDVNVEELEGMVEVQAKDVARFQANETLKEYDRGVCFQGESFQMKGSQWTSAYLPVWLYSYQEVHGEKKILHYVAVNARTKEVMGSVPIHYPKLIGMSIFVEIIAFVVMFFIDFDYEWLFVFTGIIYFFVMLNKYRNANARHTYEKDTKASVSNLRKVDNYIGRKTGLTNSMMATANNKKVEGANNLTKALEPFAGEEIKNTVLDSFAKQSFVGSILKDEIEKREGNKDE